MQSLIQQQCIQLTLMAELIQFVLESRVSDEFGPALPKPAGYRYVFSCYRLPGWFHVYKNCLFFVSKQRARQVELPDNSDARGASPRQHGSQNGTDETDETVGRMGRLIFPSVAF
jgi:hypothetical protein